MDDYLVRPAQLSDEWWIMPLLKHEKALGNMTWVWKRFWEEHAPNEHWVVVRGKGYAHFRRRNDGWNTLYEIAVMPRQRRKGIASTLIEHIGWPLRAKTDADNVASNAMYFALGFQRSGSRFTKNGKKMLHEYEHPQPEVLQQGVLL